MFHEALGAIIQYDRCPLKTKYQHTRTKETNLYRQRWWSVSHREKPGQEAMLLLTLDGSLQICENGIPVTPAAQCWHLVREAVQINTMRLRFLLCSNKLKGLVKENVFNIQFCRASC